MAYVFCKIAMHRTIFPFLYTSVTSYNISNHCSTNRFFNNSMFSLIFNLLIHFSKCFRSIKPPPIFIITSATSFSVGAFTFRVFSVSTLPKYFCFDFFSALSQYMRYLYLWPLISRMNSFAMILL